MKTHPEGFYVYQKMNKNKTNPHFWTPGLWLAVDAGLQHPLLKHLDRDKIYDKLVAHARNSNTSYRTAQKAGKTQPSTATRAAAAKKQAIRWGPFWASGELPPALQGERAAPPCKVLPIG